jgi:signal transduction histidine kinase
MGPALQDWRDDLVRALAVAYALVDPVDGRMLEESPAFAELVDDLTPGALLHALGEARTDSAGRTLLRAKDPSAVSERGDRDITATVREVSVDGRPAALVLVEMEGHRVEVERAARELAEFPRTNPGPVLRLDADGSVDLANDAAMRLFGRESLAGDRWVDLCGGITPELWATVVGSPTPVTHETDVGDRRMAFAHVWQPLRRVVFVYGSDVTVLRRQERELADQARFPDMNPGPVLRLDLSGTVLLSNVAARQLLPEATLGAQWREVCPGVTDEFWERVLRSERPLPMDATIRGRDYQFTHRPDPGRYVFVYGADVTDQRSAERAVRDTERMATLGTLAAGVAHELNNPAAAARRASSHLKTALGRLDAAERRWQDAAPPAAAGTQLIALEQRVGSAEAKPPGDPLTRADLEDDTAGWLAARAPGLDAGTCARQWVALGLGVDDLERLGVLGPEVTAALVQHVCAVAELAELVDQVERSTTRVSDIAVALKRYTYLGQAAVQDVDVHQGLDDTLLILGHKTGAGPRVVREYAADLPTVWGIGTELNQVWMNLLDNAIDATGPDGTVTVRTAVADNAPGAAAPARVRVEVEDDGPGIPPDVQPRVFEPFFTTKPPGSGTGLGLATTWSIVTERHSGSVTVESGPGRTRFVVVLPTQQPGRPSGEDGP